MIQWLFGTPTAVGTIAKNVISGSGYDFVSTNYFFDGGPGVNAQDDWSMKNVPFAMSYRVNFEHGNLIFEHGKVTERRTDGTEFEAEMSSDMGYYFEIRHFVDCVEGDKKVMVSPESSAESIRIVEAEIASADMNGQLVYLS
jgi:predicted dehydrogenase